MAEFCPAPPPPQAAVASAHATPASHVLIAQMLAAKRGRPAPTEVEGLGQAFLCLPVGGIVAEPEPITAEFRGSPSRLPWQPTCAIPGSRCRSALASSP